MLSKCHRTAQAAKEGELSPARYWSITIYDLDGFFVANPIKHYAIGNMAERDSSS